jgi:poly(hydroxyalkanoate) depolymerase family esterase
LGDYVILTESISPLENFMGIFLKPKQMILIFTFSLLPIFAFAQFKSIPDFGDNPGELLASYYAPADNNGALVVLLHGCVQDGEKLAEQSGFLSLAKQHHFSLLIPQQVKSNNIKSCFNWFSPQDIDKNQGENLSMKNMIIAVKKITQAKNVYIAGLSAGGAMANVMLVNYPDLFESGAVISGIPYACADNLIKAISCMRSGPSQTTKELTLSVKQLDSKRSTWPSLSIWTGKNDQIVHPSNALALAEHWAMLNLSNKNPQVDVKKGYQVSQWTNTQKSSLIEGSEIEHIKIELIEIEGMGHGLAVNPMEINGGETGHFLLESPISAAKHIVEFWGIR